MTIWGGGGRGVEGKGGPQGSTFTVISTAGTLRTVLYTVPSWVRNAELYNLGVSPPPPHPGGRGGGGGGEGITHFIACTNIFRKRSVSAKIRSANPLTRKKLRAVFFWELKKFLFRGLWTFGNRRVVLSPIWLNKNIAFPLLWNRTWIDNYVKPGLAKSVNLSEPLNPSMLVALILANH